MKILIILTVASLLSFIVINEKAHLYKEKTMEREFAKRIAQLDSTNKVLIDRVVCPDKYKPKKVR